MTACLLSLGVPTLLFKKKVLNLFFQEKNAEIIFHGLRRTKASIYPMRWLNNRSCVVTEQLIKVLMHRLHKYLWNKESFLLTRQ